MRHPVRRLVVVGSVVGELRIDVPNHPEPGGSVRAQRSVVQAGGCFRTVATARQLGLPAVLVGRVGDSPIGKLLRAALARVDVELSGPRTTGEHGFTMVAIENNGNASRIEVAGVEATLSRADIERVPIGSDDAVLVLGSDLVSDQAGGAIADWVAGDCLGEATLVFAPGSLAPDIPDAVLDTVIRRADILVLSDAEFALLTGVTLPENRRDAAMDLLASLAPSAMMLVRSHAEGCWLVRSDGGIWFDAPEFADSCEAAAERCFSAHLGIFLAELARLGDPVEATRIATIGWSRVPGPDRPWVTMIGPDRCTLDAMVAAAPPSAPC